MRHGSAVRPALHLESSTDELLMLGVAMPEPAAQQTFTAGLMAHSGLKTAYAGTPLGLSVNKVA